MGINAPSDAALRPSGRIRAAALRHWPFAAFFLVFNYLPLQQSLEQGNIDPLIFLLFLAFLCGVLKRWDWAAGALLGAAALIKIIAAMLIVPLLAARRFKAAAMFCVIAIIYGVILAATGAWRIEMDLYLNQLPAASFHGIAYSSSLHKWIPALAFPKLLENPEAFSRWSFLLSSFFFAGFLGVCLAAFIRRSIAIEHLLGFSFFAMLLCSPLLEYNHYVWLLPILLLHIHLWASGKMGNAAFALMSAGWLGLFLIRILNNYYRVLSFRFNILSLGPVILLGMAILGAALALRAGNTKGCDC